MTGAYAAALKELGYSLEASFDTMKPSHPGLGRGWDELCVFQLNSGSTVLWVLSPRQPCGGPCCSTVQPGALHISQCCDPPTPPDRALASARQTVHNYLSNPQFFL